LALSADWMRPVRRNPTIIPDSWPSQQPPSHSSAHALTAQLRKCPIFLDIEATMASSTYDPFPRSCWPTSSQPSPCHPNPEKTAARSSAGTVGMCRRPDGCPRRNCKTTVEEGLASINEGHRTKSKFHPVRVRKSNPRRLIVAEKEKLVHVGKACSLTCLVLPRKICPECNMATNYFEI
jgi:hypothetical protein